MLSKSAQCGPHASAPDEIDKLPGVIALVVEFLAAVSLVANVDQVPFSHRKERSTAGRRSTMTRVIRARAGKLGEYAVHALDGFRP